MNHIQYTFKGPYRWPWCRSWKLQQSTLLKVLTDGLGVEVESFSIVLLDIVCISLLFEAFRFPADWDTNKNYNASRIRRSEQLLENLQFSRSKTEHPLCALGHRYATILTKKQMIWIRKYRRLGVCDIEKKWSLDIFGDFFPITITRRYFTECVIMQISAIMDRCSFWYSS